MTTRLAEIVSELAEADRQDRIEMLIDLARELPDLPVRLARLCDPSRRVEECQSPVYLFIERDGEQVTIHADAPIEAPTVRGFVAMLVDGLQGATVEQILAVPNDLVDRAGMTEILGMQRVRGLSGVLRRLKREVAKTTDPRISPNPPQS